MQKIAIALATIAGLALIVPATSASAQEVTKKVVIKRGGGEGMHEGRRERMHERRHDRMGERHHGKKVVIIKKRGRHHDM